ncbi:protein PRY2 [Chaetomidium leptoderma]|uniref:Protein PRY2 n=1 Tax=Chaetomidium leptoderma TaxID=669021 RepID=A0AAN6VEP0_9PEZI|nr:protein PRY2 [Chaetomidium leptoderma]
MRYSAILAVCGAILVVASPVLRPGSESAAAAAEPSDYPSTAVFHHNVHRLNHSASALIWSPTLARYAQTLVNTCHYGLNSSIGGGGYGQNVAMKVSTGGLEAANLAVARAISNMWYNDQVGQFPVGDYGKPTPDMSNFGKWGGYSQVVWKGTGEVGCATAFCPAGTLADGMPGWLTVCNYSPPGNYLDRFGENVMPPLGEPVVRP